MWVEQSLSGLGALGIGAGGGGLAPPISPSSAVGPPPNGASAQHLGVLPGGMAPKQAAIVNEKRKRRESRNAWAQCCYVGCVLERVDQTRD